MDANEVEEIFVIANKSASDVADGRSKNYVFQEESVKNTGDGENL